MSDPHDKGVAELSAALQARQLSSVEVTQALLERPRKRQAVEHRGVQVVRQIAQILQSPIEPAVDLLAGRRNAGPSEPRPPTPNHSP